jgi:hypothetical protein
MGTPAPDVTLQKDTTQGLIKRIISERRGSCPKSVRRLQDLSVQGVSAWRGLRRFAVTLANGVPALPKPERWPTTPVVRRAARPSLRSSAQLRGCAVPPFPPAGSLPPCRCGPALPKAHPARRRGPVTGGSAGTESLAREGQPSVRLGNSFVTQRPCLHWHLG